MMPIAGIAVLNSPTDRRVEKGVVDCKDPREEGEAG